MEKSPRDLAQKWLTEDSTHRDMVMAYIDAEEKMGKIWDSQSEPYADPEYQTSRSDADHKARSLAALIEVWLGSDYRGSGVGLAYRVFSEAVSLLSDGQ